jgi:hypothetical protein
MKPRVLLNRRLSLDLKLALANTPQLQPLWREPYSAAYFAEHRNLFEREATAAPAASNDGFFAPALTPAKDRAHLI